MCTTPSLSPPHFGREVPPPKIGGGKVGVDRIAGEVTFPRPCPSVSVRAPSAVIARSRPESA